MTELRAVKAQARGAGVRPVRHRRRWTTFPSWRSCASGWTAATPARWRGWRARRIAARDVRAVLPQARERHRHRHPLQHRPARTRSTAAGRRAHLALRLGRRLPRRPEAAARRAGRVDAPGVAAAVRRADLRGHRPGAGARLRAVRRPGMDRQEHLPHQCRSWARGCSSAWSSPAWRSSRTRQGLEQCGTCTRCLEACPTGALVEPGVLDSTRCLSYLTIELRAPIPEPLRPALGAHVYGCDICQDVCPYNRPAPTSIDPHWQPRAGLDAPALAELCERPDAELRRWSRAAR